MQLKKKNDIKTGIFHGCGFDYHIAQLAVKA